MINKWILNNFKSIDEEKELEFRPLTIFTGANSSGKSTILQSILLVTQTLQSPIASKSVVLNGWFKKFGSFSDVVNRRDFTKNIQLGFSLKEEDEVSPRMKRAYRYRFYGDSGATSLDCKLSISADNIEDNLQPVLEKMNLIAYIGGQKADSFEIDKNFERTAEENAVINSLGETYQKSEFQYKITTDMDPKKRPFTTPVPMKYIGVSLFHFLPNYIIQYCSYKEQLKAYLKEFLLISKSSYYELERDDEKIVAPIIKDKALSIADYIYTNGKYRTDAFTMAYEGLKKRFTLHKLQRVFSNSTLDGDEKEKFIKQLLELINQVPDKYVTEREPMFYLPGAELVRSFFGEHIKYLGPLREEPKSLYPLESNGNSSDIGLKGENTAAIFENFKNKTITYVSPRFFEDGNKEPIKKSTKTLAEATNEWLEYLGVASNINTNDKGKFGHELKITTDIKDMKQDLTHVGVGVSQILPILVLCFLSEEGETIILEQPELHLHPKVQTRLADFFVSMNSVGKQCIIETHSEYLINRLRLLVARSEDTKIADNTMIYFVEKDGGHSNYRQITINKYGVIGDWPDGFFDEGEDLATKIMKAGVEKKRREMQSSKS